MPKTSPHSETPVDILTQQPVLASSSTFQLTWPAGEDPPTHSIPSAPQGVIEFSQHTPPIVNPFFDPIPMNEINYAAEGGTPQVPSAQSSEDRTEVARPAPRFSRALSTPLPGQLKHLRHPSRRTLTGTPIQTVVAAKHPLPPPPPVASNNLSELALELADSVQMVIQTLIQISPPHLLDPAKEQLSGCTLQLPTPSVSALLTTMKNLNYMSANLSALSSPQRTPELETVTEEDMHVVAEIKNADLSELIGDGEEILSTNPTSLTFDDFDIGEVLQSVGDVLSGMAAQAGVDLVLFHADVGMKHVNVRGDECGISYALCHIIRQVISTAQKNDEIEVGLFISAPNAVRLLREDSSNSETTSPVPSSDADDPLMCTLEITHSFAPTQPTLVGDERADGEEERPSPQFNATILQRLLRHVRATLQVDVTPTSGTSARTSRTIELSVLLSPGPVVPDPQPMSEEDIRARQPFNDVTVALEPTLDELATFVATEADDPLGRAGLKGKKAIFHAHEQSSFAHHLTSYLTAWGMDVSHVPTGDSDLLDESGFDDGTSSQEASTTSRSRAGSDAPPIHSSPEADPISLPAPGVGTPKSGTPKDSPKSETPGGGRSRGSRFRASETEAPVSPDGTRAGMTELAGTSFIIIDDDVRILRRRLEQIRKLAEARLKAAAVPQQIKSMKKRPSLHHRPRSSPSIRLPTLTSQPSIPGTIEEGLSDGEEPKAIDFDPLQVVLVHFTSLSNYKTVQDTIQATLYSENWSSFGNAYSMGDLIPELLVIPKPAGPRRFLTALHTAVQKPLIDPFFAPIATTPMSPGVQYRAGPWGSGPPLGRRSSGAGLEVPPGTSSRISAGRQNSSSSTASAAGSSASGRLPTLGLADRRSPKDHPVLEQQHHPSIPIPAVPMTYTGQGHMYTPHPPSPLARDAVEYFSVNTANATHIGDSAGVLVHSPDGRPAGIFFQPQQQPRDGRRSMSSGLSGDQSGPNGAGSSRPFRAGSFSQQSISLDAAIASVTSPVGTPGAAGPSRYRTTDGSLAAVGTPSPSPRMPSSPPLANRRSPASGEDPGRPPLARVGSSRFIVPLAPNNGVPRRKTSGSSPSEIKGTPSPARAIQVDPSVPARMQLVDSPKVGSPGGMRKTTFSRRSSTEAREKAALMSPLKKLKGVADGSVMPPINVLIVEDNPINQTILSTFMKRKKVNYGTAKNGQEAVDQWRAGNYHLILMDIQMPVKDGIEATKEIRMLEKERNSGISPSTPPSELADAAKASGVPHSPYRSSVIIVALTASSLKSDRVTALAAGCNDFLTKPVSMTWLNTKIIEWGSIKVLEMYQDPATARLFSGQTAKSKAIASQLKLPPSRNASPTPFIEGSPDRPSLSVQGPSTPDIPQIPKPEEPPAPEEEGTPRPLNSSHSSSSSGGTELSGDEALKKHIEEVKAKDSFDEARPVILGVGALSSEGSSTSIESVMHGIPPIAEDASPPPPDSLIQTPAIPMAPPAAGPDESDNDSCPSPPGAWP